MRAKLIDLEYPLGSDLMGVSAQWVKWKAECLGLEIVGSKDRADIALVTSTSAVEAPKIKRLKSRLGVPVVVGGAGAFCPYSYIQYGADAVVLGDGERFLNALAKGGGSEAFNLPNVMTQDRLNPTVDSGFDYDCPIFTSGEGLHKVVISFGCRHKCLFCLTSWSIKFSEYPESDMLIHKLSRLNDSQLRKISYITNDLSQHKWHLRIPKSNYNSFSFSYIKRYGLPNQRQIRMGVEGVSERLRRLVHKPISNSDLVGCSSWMSNNGKNVRWFLIAGLPTETDDDWDELKEAVLAWKLNTEKYLLDLSFTAWHPQTPAPLSVLPIDDSYWERFKDFQGWFFKGRGWSNRVHISPPQMPLAQIKVSELYMATDRDSLKMPGIKGMNKHVQYPHRAQYDRAVKQLLAGAA